ncbi:MAG TPA: toll/interleukin-1 receptor domain-containing protein [Gaiellaceae bacterium]|nr:toll/interleukin-1 receptor domain-containing protein [Gaiellaceae bacterium]
MVESSSERRGRVFISYRRQETAYPAGWLFDQLAARFGPDQVFKDVDSIELGDDFVEVIEDAVGACDVLLALIGPQWLTITGDGGKPRIEDPDDFVRLEIEAALARDVLVVPVLVDGASMPRADELPPSLAPLSHRQALELSPARFHADTSRLLDMLERTLAEVQESDERKVPERSRLRGKHLHRPSRRTTVLASVGVGVLLLVPFLFVAFASGSDSDSEATAARLDRVVFQDRFANRSGGWDDAKARRNGGHYVRGAYRLYSKWAPDHWSERGFPRNGRSVFPTAPRNVRVQVVARRINVAGDVGYGLLCRADDAAQTYYQFAIWSSKVVIAKLAPRGTFYEELAVGNLSAVRARGENRMQAVCTTDGAGHVRLAFRINGKAVAGATDTGALLGPPFTSGAVGLVVANGRSTTIEAEFDDFVVKTG